MEEKTVNREEIKNRVLVVFVQLGVQSNISIEFKLREDLGLDSHDMLELIGCLEIEFKIEIEESEFDSFKSVQDVVDFVCNKISSWFCVFSYGLGVYTCRGFFKYSYTWVKNLFNYIIILWQYLKWKIIQLNIY